MEKNCARLPLFANSAWRIYGYLMLLLLLLLLMLLT